MLSEQNGSFLKEILEPSQQDAFDHLTRMEASSINAFKSSRAEHTQPSANVGLPSHLIQCHRPRPAYTTRTAPVVKMLVEQDERRKAAAACPAEREPSGEPPGAGSVETAQAPPVLNGGSSRPGTETDSVGKSGAEGGLLSPSICSRVIFARKSPLRVAPCSSLARSSKK